MDNSQATTRRSVLQGFPLAAVAASLPMLAVPAASAASASSDVHLFALVEAWRLQYDACTAAPEAGKEAVYDRLYAIERELAAVRPVTIEGFAAKFLILTSFGEFDVFDGPAKGITDEAMSIAGIVPPRSFIEQREAIALREALA